MGTSLGSTAFCRAVFKLSLPLRDEDVIDLFPRGIKRMESK